MTLPSLNAKHELKGQNPYSIIRVTIFCDYFMGPICPKLAF